MYSYNVAKFLELYFRKNKLCKCRKKININYKFYHKSSMVYRGILIGQDPYEKSIEEIHTYKTTFKYIIIYLNNHWSSTKKHHHPFERSARNCHWGTSIHCKVCRDQAFEGFCHNKYDKVSKSYILLNLIS